MLSEEPIKRPRYSEIVKQLEKLPKKTPSETEFAEMFKAELNSKKGIDFQQNLFELFESFPIFYFNDDLYEAERIIDEIRKLVLSNSNAKNEEVNKMKIFNGDFLMCQKKYELAEKEYLSCSFEKYQINVEKHKDVRLTTLYKLMELDSKNSEKISMYRLKLEESISNCVKEPKNLAENEIYTQSQELTGFKFMMGKLMGENRLSDQITGEVFKNQIRKQTKNKEILKKCDQFFTTLAKNEFSKKDLMLYSDIAAFLVMDISLEIAALKKVNPWIHLCSIRKYDEDDANTYAIPLKLKNK